MTADQPHGIDASNADSEPARITAESRGRCYSDLYLSASSDGEGDGRVTVTAECNAGAAGDCGFYREWFLPFGATGKTLVAVITAHDLGEWHVADAVLSADWDAR